VDYTTQPIIFRLRKALRYVRLYGVRRTLIKTQGQYHMKKRYERLPEMRAQARAGAHVGIIGCGNFAFSNIAYYLHKNYGKVIRATMDVDINKAASLFERYGASYYTDDAERVISDPAIDLVFIASNHASHAEYAIRALDQGKSVHVEKPHVVNEDQLLRLCSAMSRSQGKVALGFNRPNSRIGREIKRHLDSQTGAAMYNWFIAGHAMPPDHWYFKEEEGGRVLGNLCHWTDFLFQMMPPERRYPITIRPTRALQSDCDIAVTYTFGDGSIAIITFSAKGHTFEGVRERFAAHRGNVLISMDDFKDLVVEVVDKKYVTSPLFRDHGHEGNIRNSYEMVRSHGESKPGCAISYVWETAQLFLKTREALEEEKVITLEPFEPSLLLNEEAETSEQGERSAQSVQLR
jgi:predicted dehydrogenase